MFTNKIVSHASQFWSCTITSLRRSNGYRSHRFLSSAGKKGEKQISDQDNIINAEIMSMKECKIPADVSDYKRGLPQYLPQYFSIFLSFLFVQFFRTYLGE